MKALRIKGRRPQPAHSQRKAYRQRRKLNHQSEKVTRWQDVLRVMP